MSEIHELVLHHGVERAKALARNKHDRRLVEIAAEMLAEETDRLGFSHAGFALTSLPHKAISDPVWRRDGYRVKLLVESGRDGEAELIGLPYGAKARLILLYLQTQAIRHGSREVELGRSMRSWMSAMGIVTVGGMTYKQVTEQARRISACRLTFFTRQDDIEVRQNGAFVDQEISLFGGPDGRQGVLWQETVTINQLFFDSLRKHPVPVSESALMPIRLAQLALDVVPRPSSVRAAARPGLPHAERGAGPLRVRGGPPLPRGMPVGGLVRLDRRRALMAAFRSPLGPSP